MRCIWILLFCAAACARQAERDLTVVEVDAAGKLVHELRELPWAIASIAVMPAPR